MSTFIVEGRQRLSGNIAVSGNKNEALPLIAASLLCKTPVEFTNVPDIGDVRDMLRIASSLGATVSEFEGGSVSICADHIETSLLPTQLSQQIRGSILFASSLLVRTGKALIPQPGGDTIGRRRIDTHFHVFQAMGVEIEKQRYQTDSSEEGFLYALTTPQGLRGTEIYLDEASVTATENALIAASGAQGTTVIANAASEPHVQGLCAFLQKAGVSIEGVGSNILTIHGTDSFNSPIHTVGSDYIEAGSLISLAAATDSAITITNIDTHFLRMILFQFERLGVSAEVDQNRRSVHIPDNQTLRVRKDLGGAIPRIEDSPWPGFPADLTSIMVVTATQSEGTCLIHEKMFESRLFFVDKLISMGAQIVLCDPHRAVVVGPTQLYGCAISSPDIRAGMALLIAACAAEGTSVIHNVAQIDRGYEEIDKRLIALGAQITRSRKQRRSSDLYQPPSDER